MYPNHAQNQHFKSLRTPRRNTSPFRYGPFFISPCAFRRLYYYFIPKHITAFPGNPTMSTPSGLRLSTFVSRFERLCPRSLAEKWDNVGLLVEPEEDITVKRVLLTNDLTEDVMGTIPSLFSLPNTCLNLPRRGPVHSQQRHLLVPPSHLRPHEARHAIRLEDENRLQMHQERHCRLFAPHDF